MSDVRFKTSVVVPPLDWFLKRSAAELNFEPKPDAAGTYVSTKPKPDFEELRIVDGKLYVKVESRPVYIPAQIKVLLEAYADELKKNWGLRKDSVVVTVNYTVE